jgi:hypothetical protein
MPAADIATGSVPDVVDDYQRNPAYERRVVVFYDVLGWRSQIAKAGHDVQEIGKLRRYILQHTRIIKQATNHNLRVSTFSDNIVLTQPLTERSSYFIQQFGSIIMSAALGGILIRGGITIGDVIHDDEVVFGPGLNRAYELESKLADVPRVVLDPNASHEFGELPKTLSEEGGFQFIDPFTVQYIAFLQNFYRRMPKLDMNSIGLPSYSSDLTMVPPDQILSVIYEVLRKEIRSPLEDKEYRKVSWLFDRIAARVGMPPASSYGRVSALDVV